MRVYAVLTGRKNDTKGNSIDQESLQLFEDQPIRTSWDEAKEEWYFAIVDVIAVLTESKDPSAYWRKLKQRLKEKEMKA